MFSSIGILEVRIMALKADIKKQGICSSERKETFKKMLER